MDNDHQISEYDRLYGRMHDVCIFTKPSTVQNLELTGRTETFIVQTMRHAEKGDYVFVQCMNEHSMVTRLALPPKVASAIAAQRMSLTARRRRIAGKTAMKARMERGELPGFLRKRKAK